MNCPHLHLHDPRGCAEHKRINDYHERHFLYKNPCRECPTGRQRKQEAEKKGGKK